MHVAERDVVQFLSDYRELCPSSSVFPKLHYLEDHVVRFIWKGKVGPGMMAEHGGKSVHRLFNELGDRYKNMPNPASRL